MFRDLIYMCQNAAHACVGESRVEECMRNLLRKTPTFCPDRFTLMVAPSDHVTAFDQQTASSGYITKGGDYECIVACHPYPDGYVLKSPCV